MPFWQGRLVMRLDMCRINYYYYIFMMIFYSMNTTKCDATLICRSASFVVNHRLANVLFHPSKLFLHFHLYTLLQKIINAISILSTKILFLQCYISSEKSLNYKKYILRLNISRIILENFLKITSERKKRKYQKNFDGRKIQLILITIKPHLVHMANIINII